MMNGEKMTDDGQSTDDGKRSDNRKMTVMERTDVRKMTDVEFLLRFHCIPFYTVSLASRWCEYVPQKV